jgi:hypothetical protein
VEDLITSDQPLAQHLTKGVKFEVGADLAGGLRNLILNTPELIELLPLLPIFMFNINSTNEITFDDFNEIKDHELLQPFLPSFKDIFS